MSKSKIVFLMFLTSLAISAQLRADENHPALKSCFKKAKKYYSLNAQRSDIPRGFGSRDVLPANMALTLENNVTIQYPVETALYMGSGSYHSGYFTDLIVVDAQTCEGLEIINTYGE